MSHRFSRAWYDAPLCDLARQRDGGPHAARGWRWRPEVSARSIPNLLGVFRLVATPILFWLVLTETAAGYIGACVLLLLMALSDIADGKIARRLGAVSPLGVFLDTTSDKIFVAGALLPMIQAGLLPGWIPFIVIIRDFLVSGLRSYAAAEGLVISAGQWGKQKLVITVVAIIWRLLAGAVALFPAAPAWLATLGSLWVVAMGLAVIWTVASGVEYFYRAWPMLMSDITPQHLDRLEE
ncbi:MAG: CDP-alcohol phosphatidyltransferase family protein [Roseiflexaceae bacterium]|nr:CDP-alcohol phosphatidyltransferase family protein [Roseiflexaceae bacterium]